MSEKNSKNINDSTTTEAREKISKDYFKCNKTKAYTIFSNITKNATNLDKFSKPTS
jgi:hypothetical protein